MSQKPRPPHSQATIDAAKNIELSPLKLGLESGKD